VCWRVLEAAEGYFAAAGHEEATWCRPSCAFVVSVMYTVVRDARMAAAGHEEATWCRPSCAMFAGGSGKELEC
jgi:hypothetical protein